MKELRFKNSLFAVLYVACFISCCIVISYVICMVATIIWENAKDVILASIIFSSLFSLTWIIAVIVIIFSSKIIITETEIKIYNRNKIKWSISKDDIEECIYTQLRWYMFIEPLSTINGFALQFKLKGKKNISKNFCSLSFKQIKKIQQTFDYPIRVIGTIREQ